LRRILATVALCGPLTACSDNQLYNVEGEIAEVSCGVIRNTFVTLDTGLELSKPGGSSCDFKIGDKVVVYYDSKFEIKQLIVKDVTE